METQAKTLAKKLMENGVEILVITRQRTSNLKKKETIDGIPVTRIPPIGPGKFRRWEMMPFAFLYLLKMRRKYDVLFVPAFRTLGLPAVIVSILFKKKCILKAENNGEMSGEFFEIGFSKKLGLPINYFKIFLLLRNRLLRRANYFISFSSQISDELKSNQVPGYKIVELPNGIDINKFSPSSPDEKIKLRQKLGIPENKVIAVFTGRLVSWKGLPLLVRVWSKVVSNNPDAVLVLVGGGGEDIHNCEDDLRNFVGDNNLEANVIFTGNVENVTEYLKSADIFVFPSENEAFGNSIIEAMACGLPVITTRTGGPKDIITENENGLKVTANDFNELHDAINTLIKDRNLGSKLGQNARSTAQEKYSIDTITRKYIQLFISGS
ncbi:MAG: glycosyltransferase family 4 protein [Candidatus Methanoperedens sp.]|nr:glycosyltransferase family 4 protein [Candidatus Methanoperedens sp.]